MFHTQTTNGLIIMVANQMMHEMPSVDFGLHGLTAL